MVLNVDWFAIFGDKQPVNSRVGSGFDDPQWHAPHDKFIIRGLTFNWIFPQAASLSQLIISNYDFGNFDGGINDLSEAALFINGSLIALKGWNLQDKFDDRGSVWDLNIVVLQGTPVSIRFRMEKGVNTNRNDFATSLTGTWLRDV